MASPPHSQQHVALSIQQPQPETSKPTTLNGLEYDDDSTPQAAQAPIAFPSLESPPSLHYNATLHPLQTAHSHAHPTVESPQQATPLSAGLRIQTDHLAQQIRRETSMDQMSALETPAENLVYNAGLPVRSSSIKSSHKARAHRTDSLSPGSAMSSPGVGPLVDMTPLPSPISAWGSPKIWRTSMESDLDDPLRNTSITEEPASGVPEITPFNRMPSKKRKVPLIARGVVPEVHAQDANGNSHTRQRSLSDYVPEGMQVPRSRNIAVSSTGAPQIDQSISPPEEQMHREEYLAIQRGIAISKPPTPPDSNLGADNASFESQSPNFTPNKVEINPVYEACTIRRSKIKRWKAVRPLGKGTFSKVMLATSQDVDAKPHASVNLDESLYQPSSLVAVKICEQGPAGGADEKKIEVSIKRELELMKAIDHPSMVHLKAVNMLERQTIIVENYCAGGDLFDLACLKLDYFTPPLIRRIFSELTAAVNYLHLQYIVHRDIKLENVLVNLKTEMIPKVMDWQKYAVPVVTLTDLGLGRWIPRPPESPMLDTRCGSEDYAAPEVLLGQEYDGRSTDAWALGVVLYAIMEGRLPFDVVPGSRRRSPTSHKIARCEWQWVRWADDEGEWDAVKGQELNPAKDIVEGLIAKRRSRWDLTKVAETEWVRGGVAVPGGLRRVYDEDED